MYDGLKPESMKKKTWDVLVKSWENGLSDREAGYEVMRKSGEYMTEGQIKAMCESNMEIALLRESLRDGLIAAAKGNIAREIADGNVAVSKWYLERKKASEFSTKSSVAFGKEVDELSLEEKQKQMAAYMAKFES